MVEPTNAEIFALLKRIQGDIASIKEDLQVSTVRLEQKIHDLEVENLHLKSRVLSTERKLRKNNFVIFGLEVQENSSLLDTVLKLINVSLGVPLLINEINNCYQLSHIQGKPVFLELISNLKKAEIYKNLSKLKNSSLSFCNDMIHEDRVERKELLVHLNKAKSRNLPAKIVKNTLVINGEKFTLNELKNLETEAVTPSISNNGSELEFDQSSTSTNLNDQRQRVIPNQSKILRSGLESSFPKGSTD